MKTITFLSIILPTLSFVSCKPKEVTCCHYEQPLRPIYIGFVGFDTTEVKNVLIKKYKNDDSSFTNVIDSETVLN